MNTSVKMNCNPIKFLKVTQNITTNGNLTSQRFVATPPSLNQTVRPPVGSNIADEWASISDRNTRELTSYIMRDYEELIGSFVRVLRVLKRS